MRARGRDFGHIIPVPICKAFTAAGAAVATEIDLSKLQTEQDGQPLAVLGFLVRCPTATFTQGTSKVIDGAGIAQLIAQLSLECAAGSPPDVLGRKSLIQNVDGYRALTALAFLSDEPVIHGAGGAIVQHGAGDADSGTAVYSLGSFTESRRKGYLQHQGPFGEGDASVTDRGARDVFFLPIGMAAGEDFDAFAIPASWFAGKANGGGCGTSPGAGGTLKITQGSKVDNATIGWGNEGFDVFALCVRTPRNARPCPLVPMIRTGSFTANEAQLSANFIPMFVALMKPLTAAGAQAAHAYTDVSVSANGVRVGWNESTFHLLTISHAVRREEWRPTDAELSLSNAGATRYSRALYPLVVHDGSFLKAPGDAHMGLRVQINVTNETSHPFIEAGYTAHTEDSLRRAEEWHGAGATAVSNTSNGNDVAGPVAALLPARTISLE